MNEIHSEQPLAKRTQHRVVKPDKRRGQKALLSAHLFPGEIAGDLFFPFVLLRVRLILCISSGRYVSFTETSMSKNIKKYHS